MANPTLTPFPTPPLPEQDEVTFNRNAANSLLAQANFVGEANTVVTWMGQQVTDVASYKKAAADSATAAGQAVTDAQSQVKLATDQAVASKGSADAAARQLASTETVAAAVRAQINLPSLAGQKGKFWQVADDEKTLQLVPLIVNRVGDLVVSTSPPDASFALDDSRYLQSQWPELFAKIGPLNYDIINDQAKVNAVPVVTLANMGSIQAAAMGKDEVVMAVDNGGRVMDLTNAVASTPISLSTGDAFYDIATDGKGVFVACGGGGTFARSADNGKTWSKLGTSSFTGGADTFIWQSIATDGNGRWFAFTGQGANYYLRSTDNGLTWSRFTYPNTGLLANYAYRLTHDGVSTWYATAPAGQSDLFKSTNGGLSWTAVTRPPMPATVYMSAAPVNIYMSAPAVKGNMLVVASSGDWSAFGTTYTGALFNYSFDGGISWSWLAYTNNAQQGQAYVPGKIILGGDNTAIVNETQVGSRLIVIKNLVAGKKPPILTFVVPTNFSDSFTRGIVTNGLGVWYLANNNGYRKILPSYDPKTSFYVPKFPDQPYPFQNYIKARTLV